MPEGISDENFLNSFVQEEIQEDTKLPLKDEDTEIDETEEHPPEKEEEQEEEDLAHESQER